MLQANNVVSRYISSYKVEIRMEPCFIFFLFIPTLYLVCKHVARCISNEDNILQLSWLNSTKRAVPHKRCCQQIPAGSEIWLGVLRVFCKGIITCHCLFVFLYFILMLQKECFALLISLLDYNVSSKHFWCTIANTLSG